MSPQEMIENHSMVANIWNRPPPVALREGDLLRKPFFVYGSSMQAVMEEVLRTRRETVRGQVFVYMAKLIHIDNLFPSTRIGLFFLACQYAYHHPQSYWPLGDEPKIPGDQW